MKKLYIIGNGFDLHHKLKTEYKEFARFLSRKNRETYDALLMYYGLPDIDWSMGHTNRLNEWSQFESALSQLAFEEVLEHNSDLIARPGSPDFKDGDWHTFQIEMQMLIEKLTIGLIKEFQIFILNVDFPPLNKDLIINLDRDSIFLNFNYTETLELYYAVPKNNICYIHNKANQLDKSIILGHGVDPNKFIPQDPKAPENLTEEELEYWNQELTDSYDYSYSSAKSELLTYFTKSFKNTAQIIEENKAFFNSINDVDSTLVLGHSLSDVDEAYFKEIIKRVKATNKWTVSYYGDSEKLAHMERMKLLGVNTSNLNLVRLEELK